MPRRKSERGQAIAELLAALIGMCAVAVGMLMVAALGMSGVRNTINARERADHYSMAGIANGAPVNIETWNEGRDGLPFTNDDSASVAHPANSETYLGELTDTSGMFKTAQLADSRYADHAFESRVTESNFFLSATGLTMARETVDDPLSLLKHFDAARVLNALGLPSVFQIKDTVGMPLNPVE